jgi:hypothetical protein
VSLFGDPDKPFEAQLGAKNSYSNQGAEAGHRTFALHALPRRARQFANLQR